MHRTVFSSNTTIQNYLVHTKDPNNPDTRDRIMQRIPCGSCNKEYIRETDRPVREIILEHRSDVRLMRTDNSAIAEHTYDADHLPNRIGVQCIAHDRNWYTRQVKEAIQIQLHPNTLSRDRGIDIPESWMSTIHRHMQQTKTSTVSARPTIEQPANRPPITEQHQRDQSGTLSLLTRTITEFHSRLNQLMHCDLHEKSQSLSTNSTQQNDRSQINNQ